MSWLDSLYLHERILKILLNKESFEGFVSQKKVEGHFLKGYYYLIEVTINAFINCIESLIKDEQVYDLIHYQNISLSDIPKEVRNESKELYFIKKLEEIRNKISKIRKQENSNQGEIFNELNEVIKEIYSYFLKDKTKKNSEKENLYLLNELLNKQNYIEDDFNLNIKEKEPTPIYPACNYYNLGYGNIHSEYHLQNPEIKKYNKEYLKGYALGLGFIYSSLRIVPKELIDKLINVKSWTELHYVGVRIYDSILRDKKLNFITEPLFEDNMEIFPRKLNKKIIDEKDLKFLFKKRDVLLIEQLYEGHPTFMVPTFLSLVQGRKIFEEKLEIIELKTKEKNGDIWYSYAVFVFYGGALWNGSYWILFKDIALEREDGYKSDGKRILENLLKDDEYIVHRHEINRKVFDKFLREIDFNYQKKQNLKNLLKNSNSLLVELLSLYCWFKLKNENIFSFEWGVEIKDRRKNKNLTEADLIIYTEKEAVIIQAKINLYKEADELIEHFMKVEEFLKKKRKEKIKDKQIRRELFVFFEDEFNQKDKIKKLKENSINIIFLEEILEENPQLIEKNVYEKLTKCIGKRYL